MKHPSEVAAPLSVSRAMDHHWWHTVLQYTNIYPVLCCTVFRSTAEYTTVQSSAVEFSSVQMSTVKYTMIQKSTKQLGTVCQERQSGVTSVASATGTALKLDSGSSDATQNCPMCLSGETVVSNLLKSDSVKSTLGWLNIKVWKGGDSDCPETSR